MASVLRTELINFVTHGKKRNSELKEAAEKSLGLLETLESDDLAPLAQYPEFAMPFLLACTSSNAKSCAAALQCLQTLASCHALSPSKLPDLLDALMETTQLGIAIQLKVLQLLPVILQEYPDDLIGGLLSRLLDVCAELHSDKISMVSNTAYATLQQLINSIFDRIETASGDCKIVVGANTYSVSQPMYDAASILCDLCDIAEGQAPSFLGFSNLPVPFTLELLELTLTNHSAIFQEYEAFHALLRERIVPLLLRLFSESSNEFAFFLRVARIFYLLLRRHLDVINVEAEIILKTLTRTCSVDNPLWKRIVCLEIFQGVFLELELVIHIFTQYHEESSPLKDAMNGFAAALVQTEVPMQSDSGNIISKEDCPKVPCIELLDKTEPPSFNKNYLYYLIMVCINAFSDGMTRSNSASRDKRVDEAARVNELIIETQQPLINCFTVLLGASMDIELYKTLVRSVQKMAHVCGITGLSAQRDEYMTILVQYSHLSSSSLLNRNILCIRALFNLGYALGNRLGNSWSLIVDVIGDISASRGTGKTTSYFFERKEDNKVFESSLKRLIDQTKDLDDGAINSLMATLLDVKKLRPVYMHVARQLVVVNADRFTSDECWTPFSDLILQIVKSDLDMDFKLLASSVLTDSTLKVMDSASDGPAFKQLVGSLDSLVKVDVLVFQLAAVTCLDAILDQYCYKITAGWEEIFNIISYVSNFSKPSIELYKSSFQALELICNDFLENLPYSCIFDLTLCLDKFSRQDLDLNTSFTATSLFWSVCDYLIKTQKDENIDFPLVDSESELISIAKNESSPYKNYALWMLAEIKLAHIANEPQHQIKTGATQIFFRLFESHGKKLPDTVWQICLLLVFPEIMRVQPDQDPSEADETCGIIINGLGHSYKMNLSRSLTGLPVIVDYFARVEKSGATTSLACLDQMGTILDTAIEKDLKSDEVRTRVWEFWIGHDTSPKVDERRPRATVDSLDALLRLTPKIVLYVQPEKNQLREAISLITECAKYASQTSFKPLQATALEQLQYISEKLDQNDYLFLLEKVGELSVYTFEMDVDSKLFDTLSSKAQALLLELTSAQKRLGSSSLYNSIVTMLQESCDRSTAVTIYLDVLDNQPDSRADSKFVSEGGDSIISGGKAGDSQVENIDRFFRTVEDSDMELKVWNVLLKSLSVNSLLYYRGYCFSKEFLSLDEVEAPGYLLGTIELPTPSPRPDAAYKCLEILNRLTMKSHPYAERARFYYWLRVELVLKQDIGDSTLRGSEPMYTLLRDELLFILDQLMIKESVPAKIKTLLIECIASSSPDVRQKLQKILVQDESV